MELTYKRPLNTYTLVELEQMKWDIGTLQKQIQDRENEIRNECGDIIAFLDEQIRTHEQVLNEDYTPKITAEQVRERVAPKIKELEKYEYKWKKRFSSAERVFLTGED